MASVLPTALAAAETTPIPAPVISISPVTKGAVAPISDNPDTDGEADNEVEVAIVRKPIKRNKKKWTVGDQEQWLEKWLSDYLKCQANGRRYGEFWPKLYNKWFECYPEQLVDVPANATQRDRDQLLTAALQRRVGQLQSWFRWRASPHAREMSNMVSMNELQAMLQPRERALQGAEAYGKLFSDRVDPATKIALEDTPNYTKAQYLKALNETRRKLWKEQQSDPTVKKAVEAYIQKDKEEKVKRLFDAEEGDSTPEGYEAAIEAFSPVLIQMADAAAKKTGWCITVLLGGPVPHNENGAIEVQSLHAGRNAAGQTFRVSCDTFDDILGKFGQHLAQVYPPEVCRQRALRKGLGKSEPDEVAEGIDTLDDLISLDNENPPAVGNVADIERTVEQSSGNTNPNPTPSAAIPLGGETLPAASDVVHTLPHAPPPNPPFGSGDPSLSFQAGGGPDGAPRVTNGLGWHEQVDASGLPLLSQPLSDRQLIPPEELWDVLQPFAPPINHLDWLESDRLTPMVDPFAATMAQEPFTTQVNFIPPGTNHAPVPEPSRSFQLYPALFSSPSGSRASSPDNGVGFGAAPSPVSISPAPLPNTSSTTPAPCAAPPPVSIPPAPVSDTPSTTPTPVSDASFTTPAPCAASVSIPSAPVSDVPPTTPAPSPNTSPPTTPPNDPSANDTPIQDDSRRRSGRPVAVSTRNEKLNQIGTNTLNHTPPTTTDTGPVESPLWFTQARCHLTTRDLGTEWATCVETWATFEASVNYSLHHKASLSVGGRPEEWGKWIMRGGRGLRAYEATPVIQNIDDFGIAVAKWWYNLQPKFRQGEGYNILQSYVSPTPTPDPWSSLRRGGPNGMLSLLTMLAWWGRAVDGTTQWQEDTRALWAKTVGDVTEVLKHAMANAPPIKQKRRRGASENVENNTTKRSKKTS